MSHLKHCSREARSAWCSAECPNVGLIWDNYLVSRRNYKYAVREAKHNDKVSCANRLLEHIVIKILSNFGVLLDVIVSL